MLLKRNKMKNNIKKDEAGSMLMVVTVFIVISILTLSLIIITAFTFLSETNIIDEALDYISGLADDFDSDSGSSSGYSDTDTSLVDYLLNFGGDGTTYEIDGRTFYKTYDDSTGLLTVGLDVYIDGAKEAFQVPGYVADSPSGPSKSVDNVYSYTMSKFSSGTCIYIEKELCDKAASDIRDSKMDRVETVEEKIGTKLSTQQRYALCAICYRRNYL